jgi:hypothetical protein
MIKDIVNKLKKEIIKEATSDKSGSSGSYSPPLHPGKRIFDESQLGPFTDEVSKYYSQKLAYDSYDGKMSTPKKDIKKIEAKAKKSSIYAKNNPKLNDDDGDVINPFPGKINEWKYEEAPILTEDLAVWFGTKKKPKGSKQPKGPWVNICRKVDGKHPPCGRSEADTKGYPKCRAAGVASKMTDSQKKSACAQKRREEKKDPKIGKGNKPTMVSYKPKKK